MFELEFEEMRRLPEAGRQEGGGQKRREQGQPQFERARKRPLEVTQIYSRTPTHEGLTQVLERGGLLLNEKMKEGSQFSTLPPSLCQNIY